jgi:small subunit ribosomal protein S15
MYLTPEKKAEIFQANSPKGLATDTGSVESQIALLTYRISSLTEHLKKNRKDKSTQFGLLKLVGHRRRMLAYLKKKDINGYRNLTDKLGIRRQN